MIVDVFLFSGGETSCCNCITRRSCFYFARVSALGLPHLPSAIQRSVKPSSHPVCEIESSTMRNDWIPNPLETAMLIAATVIMSSGFVVLAMG